MINVCDEITQVKDLIGLLYDAVYDAEKKGQGSVSKELFTKEEVLLFCKSYKTELNKIAFVEKERSFELFLIPVAWDSELVCLKGYSVGKIEPLESVIAKLEIRIMTVVNNYLESSVGDISKYVVGDNLELMQKTKVVPRSYLSRRMASELSNLHPENYKLRSIEMLDLALSSLIDKGIIHLLTDDEKAEYQTSAVLYGYIGAKYE